MGHRRWWLGAACALAVSSLWPASGCGGHGSVATFVKMMNAKAQQLGLTETHFENPDGLDAAGHYSSARDVTKLAQIVMHDPFTNAASSEARYRTSEATSSGLPSRPTG